MLLTCWDAEPYLGVSLMHIVHRRQVGVFRVPRESRAVSADVQHRVGDSRHLVPGEPAVCGEVAVSVRLHLQQRIEPVHVALGELQRKEAALVVVRVLDRLEAVLFINASVHGLVGTKLLRFYLVALFEGWELDFLIRFLADVLPHEAALASSRQFFNPRCTHLLRQLASRVLLELRSPLLGSYNCDDTRLQV